VAKNLIIGGFTNYEINQLKPWVLSAKEVAGDDDVVLITGKTTTQTIDWLTNQGVIIFPMKNVDGVPIHVLRFLSIYEYLRHNWSKYKFVVTTDVKDVFFQYTPFAYIENNITPEIKLFVASEGLRYKDEPLG